MADVPNSPTLKPEASDEPLFCSSPEAAYATKVTGTPLNTSGWVTATLVGV